MTARYAPPRVRRAERRERKKRDIDIIVIYMIMMSGANMAQAVLSFCSRARGRACAEAFSTSRTRRVREYIAEKW